jgi:hypothetical protein
MLPFKISLYDEDEIRHRAINLYISQQISVTQAWTQTILAYFEQNGYTLSKGDAGGSCKGSCTCGAASRKGKEEE